MFLLQLFCFYADEIISIHNILSIFLVSTEWLSWEEHMQVNCMSSGRRITFCWFVNPNSIYQMFTSFGDNTVWMVSHLEKDFDSLSYGKEPGSKQLE